MTAENTPTPDGPEPVDWDRLEAELGGRDGGRPPTATTDAEAGTARVLVDSPEAQRPARGDLRDAER